MKRVRNILIWSVVASLFASCAMQKRQYMSGYYVSRSHHAVKPQAKPEIAEPMALVQRIVKMEKGGPAAPELRPVSIVMPVAEPVFHKVQRDSVKAAGCDTLFFRNGDKVLAQVSEISQAEIRYKKCNNLTGPNFVTAKYEITEIHYANGYRETITAQPPAPKKEEPKKNTRNDSDEPPRKQIIVTGLLSFIFGVLGILLISSNPLVGLLFSVTALTLSIVSMVKVGREPDRYRAKWTYKVGFYVSSGIVLGILIGIIIAFLTI